MRFFRQKRASMDRIAGPDSTKYRRFLSGLIFAEGDGKK